MLRFGGTPTFVYEGDPEHRWTIVDRRLLPTKLQELEPNEVNYVDTYEKTVKGTQQLYADLQQKNTSPTYRLGCILYHQLLYKNDLRCIYQS
jgi:hypothetical protein